jgi:hypothetical protein
MKAAALSANLYMRELALAQILNSLHQDESGDQLLSNDTPEGAASQGFLTQRFVTDTSVILKYK